MIDQVADEYLQITVSDPKDKGGFKTAETALKRVVRMRTTVEKTRKALKADSLRYGKAVDGEAKRIRERIEPIETHLKTQCDIVRLEEARQKVAAENARRDKINGWVKELSELGATIDLPALQQMDEGQFALVRLSAKKRYDEQAEERAAIAKERAELEELRAEKARRESEQKVADRIVEKSVEQSDRANEVQMKGRGIREKSARENICEILEIIPQIVVFVEANPDAESDVLRVLEECSAKLSKIAIR